MIEFAFLVLLLICYTRLFTITELQQLINFYNHTG